MITNGERKRSSHCATSACVEVIRSGAFMCATDGVTSIYFLLDHWREFVKSLKKDSI